MRFLLPLCGLWLVLYGSFALSRPPLPDGPNTMHAEIAREMVTRGDCSTAYANGFPVKSSSRALDWSIAASYKLFGVSDWSARLPLALCVLGTALTLFFFGRRLFGSNAAGFYAALFFFVWPGTFLATRSLTGTALLGLETTLVACILWHFLVTGKLVGWNTLFVAGAALALIFFTGSWPAAVLPALVVLTVVLVRFTVDPARQIREFLGRWAMCAVFFALLLEGHSRNPLSWLAPVPPLALMLGGRLVKNEIEGDKTVGERTARYLFVAGILLAAMAAFFGWHGPVGYSVFHRNLVMATPGGRIALFIAAAALIAGVTGNLLFRLRNKARVANCFLAGTLGGLIVAIQAGMVIASPHLSSQILADAIRPELNPTDVVIIDGKYPDASSLAFYLERPVLIALPGVTDAMSVSPPPRGTAVVNQIWEGSARVFLWTGTDHPLPLPGKSFVVARSGGKQILSNEPNAAGAAF